MKTLILIGLALGAAYGQQATAPAVGDSVLYNEHRYAVIDSLGAPILPQDSDFRKRAKAKAKHEQYRLRVACWLAAVPNPHIDVIPPDSPLLLLHATFAEIASAPKTTGYVIWRVAEADTTIHVNVPAEDLTRIDD